MLNRRVLIKISCTIIFCIMVIMLFSYSHESTHQQINTYYGCDSTIEFTFLMPEKYVNGLPHAFMATIPDKNCNFTEGMVIAHSFNEVIGYNVMPILELVLMLFVMKFIIFDT